MRNNIIILFLLYTFFISCKQKNTITSEDIIISDTLWFDTGFIPNSRCSGSYFDKKHNKTLIYFSDLISQKTLKIFDDQARELYSIDLNDGLYYLDNDIYNIELFSLDTIVLSAFYNNKLAYINSKGELWKTADLTSLMVEDNNRYVMHPSSNRNAIKINDNSIVLRSSWSEITDTVNSPQKNEYNKLTDWYTNSYKSYYFFKIDNIFSEIVTGNFKIKQFYHNLYEVPHIFVEPDFYRVINNKIFVFSTYSDSFLIFDSTSFELLKKVKLTSDYTKIGIEPISLNEENFSNLQEIVNQKARRVGYTEDILYDEKTKRYFVMQHHESLNRFRSHQFSILILDENFEKIDEIPFIDGKIKSWIPIMTDKGLMFCSNANTDDEDAPKKFYIIDL